MSVPEEERARLFAEGIAEAFRNVFSDPLADPPRYRCYGLNCEHVNGFPERHPKETTIPCRNGCGRIYCSESCEESQWNCGHKYACKYVLEGRNRAGGDPDYADPSYGEMMQTEETPEISAVAEDNIERNTALPAIFLFLSDDEPVQKRRFRVGQRVLALNAATWKPGTIVSLAYPEENPMDEDGPPICRPYEIELDSGTYCSAPGDADESIRRLPGAPVLIDEYQISDDMIPLVQEELIDMMYVGTAEFRLKFMSKLDRHKCSSCGKPSEEELRACTRCTMSTYCNSSCQRADYQGHRKICKRVAGLREKFASQIEELEDIRVRNVPGTPGYTPTDRERFEASDTFLREQAPSKDFEGLMEAVHDAVRAVKRDDPVEALQELVEERRETYKFLVEGIDKVFTSDNVLRLIAGVLYFWDKSPDVAEYCAVGADFLLAASHFGPLKPYVNKDNLI